MRKELSYEELRGYSMEPMESDEDIYERQEEDWRKQEQDDLHDKRVMNPKAGAIVLALGNYRRTHRLFNFYYRIKAIINIIKQEKYLDGLYYINSIDRVNSSQLEKRYGLHR